MAEPKYRCTHCPNSKGFFFGCLGEDENRMMYGICVECQGFVELELTPPFYRDLFGRGYPTLADECLAYLFAET
jgi:hypothetical protein